MTLDSARPAYPKRLTADRVAPGWGKALFRGYAALGELIGELPDAAHRWGTA